MQLKNKVIGMLAACGAAAGAANAQPFVVNISGATLQQNFFNALASTNDYIDVDGDSIVQENVAPYDVSPPFPANQYWQVQYRATGSGNGLAELVKWGGRGVWAVDMDCVEICSTDAADGAYNNRTTYVSSGGGTTGDADTDNPGAAPVRSLQDGSYFATVDTNPATTGIQVNLAVLDVPVSWFVYNDSGSPAFFLEPTEPGYGFNSRKAVNKDGTDAGQSNKLKSLGTLNTNTGNPDQNTVFDTLTATAPVAALVNYGVGRSQMTYSEIRHLLGTGRLPSGENLMMVTRDSGSGTRNAFNNSFCMDPSWCVGENVGLKANNSAQDLVGPDYIPSNKGGSSRMEATVINTRLGVGYTGAERGVNKGLFLGKIDCLAVKNDINGSGSAQYVRPNIDAILDNDYDNGYNISGPASWATLGDPFAESVADGGDDNGNPKMDNFAAAQYVLNVSRSIDGFAGDPGDIEELFSPGEWLAVNLLLPQATDNVAAQNHPCDLIPNPRLNQALQDYTRANSILGEAEFYTFGLHTLDGTVPTRTTGVVYSDGVAGGSSYISQGGSIVTYATALKSRNRIAGDFNGDGKRNINDAADLVKAYVQREGGAAWIAPNGTGDIAGAPGTDAVIEILGDFNGDGNFDIVDARYWADGLGVNATTGLMDRKAAFEALDNATAGGNFFGTTIDGGMPYTAGDSRADVAGNLTARGWAPIGADGVIDMADVDYIEAQFVGNPFVTDGEANWDDLTEAVGFDLSCDVTGDLKVNQDDVNAVLAMLGLDCYADFNGDGSVNTIDVLAYLNAWAANDAAADCNGDGSINTIDVLCFLNAWATGC